MANLNKTRVIPWMKGANEDHNLDPWYWYNTDKAQTHYFTSILNETYPNLKEAYKTPLVCPPNRCLFLLHRYWRIWTRDGTPPKGFEPHTDVLELFPAKVFTRGGALGHES